MTTTTPSTTTLLDDAAITLRTVLAKWTPGNPARLQEVRDWLTRYDELIAMEQRAAERARAVGRMTPGESARAIDEFCGF